MRDKGKKEHEGMKEVIESIKLKNQINNKLITHTLMYNYRKLSDEEEYYAREIVDIAIKIYKILGPGLLESVYEKCFCHELKLREIAYQRQLLVPIIYEGLKIDDGLKLDILVGGLVIVELKAQPRESEIWESQLLSYLQLTGKRLGFITNFHVPLMKDGIKRMVL